MATSNSTPIYTTLTDVTGTPATVSALQYKREALDDGHKVAVWARGPIVEGDVGRLRNFFEGMPKDDQLIGFVLDSPGGSLIEAEKLAGFIQRQRLVILIPTGGECTSACFLLFAAAPGRVMARDAVNWNP